MLLTVKAGVTHFLIHGPCTAHCHWASVQLLWIYNQHWFAPPHTIPVVLTRAHQQTHTLATATAIHIPGFAAFLISLGKPDVKSGFARLAGCRFFSVCLFCFSTNMQLIYFVRKRKEKANTKILLIQGLTLCMGVCILHQVIQDWRR